MENKLKLIVPENFREFGQRVNKKINLIRQTDENYIVDMELPRFSNGEGKCVINESVRNQDVYILTDISNYDVTYKAQRGIQHMMPDEHNQDIKRIISAINGHASRLTLVMPLLYQSRQEKRTIRESLDCAMALQALERYNVSEIITFDAHNPTVENAVPNKMTFSNGYATEDLISDFLIKENVDINNLFVVGPDMGARSKAKFLADILGGIRYGNFEKRRNYEKVENGKNRIEYHAFVGPEKLDGTDIILFDDMISSGTTILDAAKKLKERGASKIYIMVTFASFTDGVDKFNEFYEKGIFDKVYSTNLAYVPDEYKALPWFESVDCSLRVAQIISNLNEGKSIREYLNGKEEMAEKVKSLKRF